MSDYSKLTNYLNEGGISASTSTDSINNGLNNFKNSVSGFFTQTQSSFGINTASTEQRANSDDQIDSWFREADDDKYCPKMVRTYLKLLY